MRTVQVPVDDLLSLVATASPELAWLADLRSVVAHWLGHELDDEEIASCVAGFRDIGEEYGQQAEATLMEFKWRHIGCDDGGQAGPGEIGVHDAHEG